MTQYPLDIMMSGMEAQFSAEKLGKIMDYLFCVEGLNREVWQAGESRKAARATLWAVLTDDEQNRVVQIECIDERVAA